MRKLRLLLAIISAALVAVLAVALRSRTWPLGVRGEWEWLRLATAPAAMDVVFAALAVVLYAGCAALGLRYLTRRPGRGGEAVAVGVLLAAALVVQAVVPIGAPEGYGIARWPMILHMPASTGYYTVAREQIHDLGRFLAEYPEWIRKQDALHVGTHPPGLFLVEHALLRAMASRPGLARWVVDHLPAPVAVALRVIDTFDPLTMADRAALGVSGALTLFACATTVVPLYVLARASLPAPAAWSAAVLWPLVPSAILFQPLPDIAYPLLATTALALAVHATRAGDLHGGLRAAGAGFTLALGMAFTLAFLAVGLVVAIVLASAPGLPARRRARLLLATAAGFLAPTLAFWWATGADPFVIWWWNQRNHARFYVEFHRTYALWLLINPVELALALGIPAAVWAVACLSSVRSAPRVAWATLAVLVLLTVSGRSLSEVARLWLPLMPPLLTAGGGGLEQLGAGPRLLAFTIATLGAETLLLQATIQVVYPV
jgi:hypothetical protein